MKNFYLPQDYKPYIDKYFLRAKEILQKENLNPMVKVQVFIRKGGVRAYGIDEAIAILARYSDIEKTGHVYALREGDYFEPCETLMIIEAPIQSIIDLETMYLGVLSADTTLFTNRSIKLSNIRGNMETIVDLVKPRPVSYFGARHWRYTNDYLISNTCRLAGAKNCSTDAGATSYFPPFDKGIGTIPHALEAIYHWKDGLENAVKNATIAFDKHIDPRVPRIALVDYANREIRDSIVTAEVMGDRLYGIRIDTCGENHMEGTYCGGKGVSVEGVYAVRKSLDINGFKDVKIILSSGFGNIEKVKKFLGAEKKYGVRLFDGLGVGGVFDSRMATADIIEVEGIEIHKVGRMPIPNLRLVKIF